MADDRLACCRLESILVTRVSSLILRAKALSLSPSQNSFSRLTLVLRPEMTMECLLTELLPPFTVLRITPSDCKLAPALWALSKEKSPAKWIGRAR